ncbi:MAG TPA: proton-conducting transporter membrane subunit [Nitrososphaerales archaeon]|nr:proton-conducting transporter membrane subunit [Nitrososphaerales archaeon]
MAYPYLLVSTVIVPLVGAAVCYLAAPGLGRRVGWIAFLSILLTTVQALFVEGPQLFGGTASFTESYQWAPTAGLTFGFLADGLSLPVLLVINLVLAATTVFSMPYMHKRIQQLDGGEQPGRYGMYYLNYLLISAGLAGIVLSTNLIEIYLFLEMVLVPTFVIISIFGYAQKERVAIIYIIWNQLGAFIFLSGIALFYTATTPHTFDLNPSSLAQATASPLAYWIAGLILVGWLVKMAVFGVHMWLPITEAEPPTAFAPTMAVVSGVGNYVIVRLLLFGMPGVFQVFSLPLMAWAVLTMFYAGAVAVAQTDVKYLFAWSTMSQNAYSILGIASFSLIGATGGIFYFLSHIMGKFVMFSVAGILLVQTGRRDLREMGGLAGKMPFTATLFLLGALILSAVPPTSGFQAEWTMFAGIFRQGAAGSPTYMAVAALGLVATLFTVAYTLWPMRRIFFGALPQSLADVKEAPLTMTLPLLAVVVISVVIGIYPDLVFRPIYSFASGLYLGLR